MDKYKAILLALVKSAKLLDNDGVAALEAAEEPTESLAETLASNLTNHIKTVSEEVRKTAFDEGHGKGTREVMGNFEKQLAEKFGVEAQGKKGVDLISHIVEAQVKANSKAASTEEEVKKHPAFLQVNDKYLKLNQDLEAIKKEKDDLLTFKTQAEQNALNAKVLEIGRQKFLALNPVLPDDETLKTNKIKFFEKALLSEAKFKLEGENVMLVDDKGDYLTHEMGHRKTIDDLVPSIVDNYFGRQQQSKKQGAGAGEGGQGGNGGDGGFKVPIMKTEADFLKAANEAKTHEEAAAVGKAWEEQNKQQS